MVGRLPGAQRHNSLYLHAVTHGPLYSTNVMPYQLHLCPCDDFQTRINNIKDVEMMGTRQQLIDRSVCFHPEAMGLLNKHCFFEGKAGEMTIGWPFHFLFGLDVAVVCSLDFFFVGMTFSPPDK